MKYAISDYIGKLSIFKEYVFASFCNCQSGLVFLPCSVQLFLICNFPCRLSAIYFVHTWIHIYRQIQDIQMEKALQDYTS